MQALPAGPAAPPRRLLLAGTALAGTATLMLIGGMLAVWYVLRARAVDAGEPWLPEGVVIPEVAANLMLIGIFGLLVFAQWAVYAARRRDRVNTALALGLVAFMAVAVVNAQAFIFSVIELPVAEGPYPGMFYAVTGTMVALLVIGVAFSLITAFRALGARSRDAELVSAHALYWYVLTAAFVAVWFVVYVTK